MTQADVYLDYNATTPCDPRVVEAMLPFFSDIYGNPANGLHKQGRLAARYVEEAREQVASLIGADASEIIFTAGATESNNLAILGLARRADGSERKRIIISAVEHKSVLLPCERLLYEGYEVIVLPVNDMGQVQLKAVKEAVNDNTLLVSIQGANNEVGTIQPIPEIAEVVHQYGAVMHCDAAQALGKIPLDVDRWGVDLLSISAHKICGPKGIGTLYMRGGPHAMPLDSIQLGGGQERGLRSGTLNVSAIVGFGHACLICSDQVLEEAARLTSLRNDLERKLRIDIPEIIINGDPKRRLPNTSSLTLPRVDADALLLNVPHLMLGTGSACASRTIEPSHVLQAMSINRQNAFRTVRVSIGRFTTPDEIDIAKRDLVQAYQRLLNG